MYRIALERKNIHCIAETQAKLRYSLDLLTIAGKDCKLAVNDLSICMLYYLSQRFVEGFYSYEQMEASIHWIDPSTHAVVLVKEQIKAACNSPEFGGYADILQMEVHNGYTEDAAAQSV